MTETDENIRSQDDSYENEGGTVTITLKEYDKLRERQSYICLLYTSPSPRDKRQSRMPSSA